MRPEEIKNTSDLIACLPEVIEPNQPAALVPRGTCMTPENFAKTERIIAQNFRIEEKGVYQNVPISDDLGHVIRWEYQEVGREVVAEAVGVVDPRLYDSIRRPATPALVAAHLTRLAAHLRHTKGEGAWQIVMEDVARDLIGVSEWAVIKACAEFRSGTKPFFPDTPELLACIRKWDGFARRLGNPKGNSEPKEAKPKPPAKPTPQQRQNVCQIMHDAGFHVDKQLNAEYCPDCRSELAAGGAA